MLYIYVFHLSPSVGKNIPHFIDGKTELGEGEVHRSQWPLTSILCFSE